MIKLLPEPDSCDMCDSSNIVLTTNAVIYGRDYGKWPKLWYCNDCKAAVGCHPNTNIPLGRMADKETRELRKKVHDVFDRIWKSGSMNRSQAYEWLAQGLKIPAPDCHISWLTKEQLSDALVLSSIYLECTDV